MLRRLIFKIPISCNENIIIIKPAITLSMLEFCNKNFPNTDAVAPNMINTNENPSENSINGRRFIFLLSNNSFKDCPEIKEI